MKTRYWARAVVNWVTLSTPLGLLIAGLGRAVVTRKPDGLYLAENCRLMLPDAGAFTVGNVIITGRKLRDLYGTDVLAHEAAHASQWAILGPAFLPVYLAMTAWSLRRTGDRAARNYLERWAGLARGGYVEPQLP
ncbi:MAG: hypothetical protein FWD63_07245 [Propionibacteriaceae bacterium]|nr:hypothetical protein [Propionibacteriaceae bacterium]